MDHHISAAQGVELCVILKLELHLPMQPALSMQKNKVYHPRVIYLFKNG